MRGITRDHIDTLLRDSRITTAKFGEKTTVLHCQLPNGFEVVTSSACVNPEDYDRVIGERICRERLVDKVWELEGYRAHVVVDIDDLPTPMSMTDWFAEQGRKRMTAPSPREG